MMFNAMPRKFNVSDQAIMDRYMAQRTHRVKYPKFPRKLSPGELTLLRKILRYIKETCQP